MFNDVLRCAKCGQVITIFQQLTYGPQGTSHAECPCPRCYQPLKADEPTILVPNASDPSKLERIHEHCPVER